MPAVSCVSVHANRVRQLRQVMVENGIDAVIVPSSDPHLSEYPPARWCGREWLSGFTGSAGTLVVTYDFAGIWTDSRYWEQAEAEMAGNGVATMRIGAGATPSWIEWLAQSLDAGQSVWIDGTVVSLQQARQIERALLHAGVMLNTEGDLLDAIWPNRPRMPANPVYEHDVAWAGTSRSEKLAVLRTSMRTQSAQWHFISTLDDIAWLFNLRGSDVPFNPVFLAHALIAPDQTTLFINEEKLPQALQDALKADGVALAPYDKAMTALSSLGREDALLLDPRRIAYSAWQAVPAAARIVEAVNPTTLAKARKGKRELAHVRAVMEQDGAALCEFFCWLEHALCSGENLTEIDVGEKLLAMRQARPGFVSPSFDTIAGFNANGALPHYRAVGDRNALVAGSGLLLIDSGGQYPGGTTDITRTVAVGNLSAAHKRDFTLVLKGLIALSSAHFPRGLRSPMLDAIARAPLWGAGLDYGHGTGHGVGYFLNVHEGPQSISCHAAAEPQTAMEEGMITSVEPAVYRPGRWGVRIENLVAAVPAETTDFGDFLRFETLTLCPIDTRCIDTALLRADEIAWLNAYHAEVRARLLPLLQGDAGLWLHDRTAPL